MPIRGSKAPHREHAMTEIIIRPMDQIAERFGRQLLELGERKARTVFMRALNYEGKIAYNRVKRATRDQGSFKAGSIAKGIKWKGASRSNLNTEITGTGREENVSKFGGKQFRYGVRAKVWRKFQQYPHTFTVAAYGGMAYVREGKGRGPLKGVYGPSIAKEIVRDEAPQAYHDSLPRIVNRIEREIASVLRGF